MENKLKLFVVLLGGKQADDKIEAHNLFIGVGTSIESLLPAIKKSWRGVKKLHIDSWEEVTQIDGHAIKITPNTGQVQPELDIFPKLLIVNIGYYVRGVNSEMHRLLPLFIKDKKQANLGAKLKKLDEHFRKGQRKGVAARSHVDDQYVALGFKPHKYDIDDSFDVQKEVPEYLFEYIPLPKSKWRKNKMKSGFLFVKEFAALPE